MKNRRSPLRQLAAILGLSILIVTCIEAATSLNTNSLDTGGFSPTTQPAPGIAPAPALAPATQPAAIVSAPRVNVTDEQIGTAITHGVDFLLANFEKNQLKQLDGMTDQVNHDGLDALCVYALLTASQATHDPRLNIHDPLLKGMIDQLKRDRMETNPQQQSAVVFERALRAAALAVYNRPEDHAALTADVNWLIHAQRDGGYTDDDNYNHVVQPAPMPPESDPGVVSTGGIETGMTTGSVVAGVARSGPVHPTIRPNSVPFAGGLGPQQPFAPRFYGIAPFGRMNVIDRCIPSRGGAIVHNPVSVSNMPPPPSTPPSSVTMGTPAYLTPPSENPQPTQVQLPWDNLNSQFGLLGVWAGAEAGVEVPTWYWQNVQDHWLNTETAQGQWYLSDYNTQPSIGMTWAGDWALFVTHDWLGLSQKASAVGNQPYSPGLKQALAWLETGDNSVTLNDSQTYYVGYNLFMLERVGQASGFKYLGTHDWYREIASRVVPVQWPNGAFGRTPDGYDAVVQTAYTVIFLSRGRHPIFMEKLRFDGAWANRPRDIANVARFASHELERPLNWQVVPVEHNWQDWLDSPVLYIASHQPPALSDADLNNLRSYVQSGGMLFTHADGGSDAFNDFVEHHLAPALFPQYTMQDIPEDDPIYTLQYHLKSPAPKLRGVSNGSRWLLVHSPADLAANWQTRAEKPARSSFELAVNLFVYAAGKNDFRNRIVSSYIPEPDHAPSNSINVARLSYNGNWDPEPYAWTRFDRWMQTTSDRKLNIQPTAITDLKPGAAPLAVLTGNSDFTPGDSEIAALKSFVEAGGWLLIDDCGGTGKFSASTEKWLATLSSEKFAAIAPTDPILTGGGAMKLDDLSKPKYRQGTVDRLGDATKPLSLSLGKGRIIYSPIDITTGLLDAQNATILGYQPVTALSLAKNVTLQSAAAPRNDQ